MNKVGALIMVLTVAGAYLLGWWPEHQRRLDLAQQVETMHTRIAASDTNVRLCALQDRLLAVLDLIEAQNFGAAQSAASEFFDAVRAETRHADHDPVLDDMLAQRDAITIALTHSDPAGLSALRAMRAPLRALREPPAQQ
jgi:hypothetical protein